MSIIGCKFHTCQVLNCRYAALIDRRAQQRCVKAIVSLWRANRRYFFEIVCIETAAASDISAFGWPVTAMFYPFRAFCAGQYFRWQSIIVHFISLGNRLLSAVGAAQIAWMVEWIMDWRCICAFACLDGSDGRIFIRKFCLSAGASIFSY